MFKEHMRKYIKDKPAVFLSMVPQDQPNLVLSNSTQADVKEEEIVPGAEKNFSMKYGKKNLEFEKTPTKHDRSEPPFWRTSFIRTSKGLERRSF